MTIRTLGIIACVVLALAALTTAALGMTVTGVDPQSGAVREELETVTIAGAGFPEEVQVTLRSGHTWIDAEDVTRVDATTIRCRIAIPWDATPGEYGVYVTSGTETARLSDAFVVTGPPSRGGPVVPARTIGPTSAPEGEKTNGGAVGAKNVILMIGDGMGAAQIEAGRWEKSGHNPATYPSTTLAMDGLDYTGWVRTASANSPITDSAAAATALMTGTRTNNGMIGISPGGTWLTTIAETAEAQGRATGAVSTTRVSHATPAGVYAHVGDRTEELLIASQFIDSDLEVMLSGGYRYFIGTGSRDPWWQWGYRTDGRNLVTEAQSQGYTVVTTASGLAGAPPGMVLGLFSSSSMAYEGERPSSEPSLAAMTGAALSHLDDDPDGFFLMVEGGNIDTASHVNEYGYMAGEVLAFDAAVATALAYADTHPDTLLIVTADHETGGLSIQAGGDGWLTFTFTTTDHTGVNVPIRATGPGADTFAGTTVDNTAVHTVMYDALTLPPVTPTPTPTPTVTPVGPTVTGINPSTGVTGATLTGVEITGTGFVSGAEVILQSGADGSTAVIASGETVVNANLLRCTLTLGANAYPAAYTIWLRNPGGTWVYLDNAFTITPSPAVTVTGISPTSGTAGTTLDTLTVTGTNFVAGAEVVLKNTTGGVKYLYPTGVKVINPTQIQCTLAIPASAYQGLYTVCVKNPGGNFVYLDNAFTVTPSPPVAVTGISPTSGAAGTTLSTVTVTGTNFVAGAEVVLKNTTSTVKYLYPTGATVISPTQIQCALAIQASAYQGLYTVCVKNPGGNFVYLDNAFTVTPSPPVAVTGISPTSGAAGTTVDTVNVTEPADDITRISPASAPPTLTEVPTTVTTTPTVNVTPTPPEPTMTVTTTLPTNVTPTLPEPTMAVTTTPTENVTQALTEPTVTVTTTPTVNVTPTLTDLMTRVTITPTVTTAPLVANFTWPDETMTPMVPVNFTDCSTGTPTQWFWEVENETFTTQIITHTFMDPGTFTVNLTVEDADGETATIVKEIEVAAPATITSIPESQVTTMTTPDPTVTDSSATSPDAGAPATMVTMAAPGPRDRLR